MAFAVKYRSEFKDMQGIDWKIDILEDSFVGDITSLIPTGDPLVIHYDNDSDDIFDPIHESHADIKVYSETNFALAELYSVEDMQFQVNIYQDDTLYWTGYINPRNYSEPYDDYLYPVTISCSDGLGILGDILYDNSGSYYTGRKLESQILLDILGKIGYTTFTEYINIYEESMTSTTGYSPLDQVKVDVYVFEDMYCDEVITNILRKYNACVIQKAGVFVFYRPEELTGTTVYSRTFTGATTKSASSFSPVQYINRSTNPSNLQQIPGGVVMVQSPAKKVTIHQDYGSKESWLRNYQFRGDTWEMVLVTGTFDYWTSTLGIDAVQIKAELPTETNGALLTGHNTYPTLDKYISQNFATYSVYTSTDGFVLDFDYLFVNTNASTVTAGKIFYVEVSTNSYYYLNEKDPDDSATLRWSAGVNQLAITTPELPIGVTEWYNYRRTFTTLPASGVYTIKFYGLDDTSPVDGVYVGIRNVKFCSASVDISSIPLYIKDLRGVLVPRYTMFPASKRNYRTVKEFRNVLINEYEKTNAINGIDIDIDYILGDVTNADLDNVVEQFAGSLCIDTVETLTLTAADFVIDHAGDYSSGGVTLTSSGEDVIFTATVPGVAFTGASSITNLTGTLDGTLPAGKQTANVAAVARVDTILLSGTSGSFRILCEGVTQDGDFTSDINTTASTFVTDHAADYLSGGDVILTSNGATLYFTAKTAGTDFTENDINFLQLSGDMDGSITSPAVANVVPVAQVSTVTLSGTTGTAEITCDAVTQEIDVDEIFSYTSDWNTRSPGSESKELLEIICDEIAAQYARPKQLIQLPILDIGTGVSSVNILGNFQDDLNTISAVNRKFVFNRGNFDVKNRIWNIDLVEVI